MMSVLLGSETVVVAMTGGTTVACIFNGLVGTSVVTTSTCVSSSRISKMSSPEIK